MKISTVRQFRDNATVMLRSRAPILVTRRGQLAGIFLPTPAKSLPIELKRELFDMLTAAVARQLRRKGLTEETVVADFEAWRKQRRERREARRRR